MKEQANAYRAFKEKHSFDMCEGATDSWREKLGIIEGHLLNENADLFEDPGVRHAISEPVQAKINHRAHLDMFLDKTGIDPYGFNCVVEIGGGFGGMCELIGMPTHVIVDFPVMLFLQSWFLKTPVMEGLRDGVNFMPVQFRLDDLSQLQPDLLLSCWSLSEASKEAQERFRKLRFFDAKYILHGYATSKTSELPYTDFKDFDGYEVMWEGSAFKSTTERYRFMRKQ